MNLLLKKNGEKLQLFKTRLKKIKFSTLMAYFRFMCLEIIKRIETIQLR